MEDQVVNGEIVKESTMASSSISKCSSTASDSHQPAALIPSLKNDELLSFKCYYFCSLCNKQYNRQREIDNHLQSYDHAHRQRLQDLRTREFCRKMWNHRRRRGGKRSRTRAEDKELERLTKFANERAEVVGTSMKAKEKPNEDVLTQPAPVQDVPRDDASVDQENCYSDANYKDSNIDTKMGTQEHFLTSNEKDPALRSRNSNDISQTKASITHSSQDFKLIRRNESTASSTKKKRSKKNHSTNISHCLPSSREHTKSGQFKLKKLTNNQKSKQMQILDRSDRNSVRSEKVESHRMFRDKARLRRKDPRRGKEVSVREESSARVDCRFTSYGNRYSRSQSQEDSIRSRQSRLILQSGRGIKDSRWSMHQRTATRSASHMCNSEGASSMDTNSKIHRQEWFAARIQRSKFRHDSDRANVRYSRRREYGSKVNTTSANRYSRIECSRSIGNKVLARPYINKSYYNSYTDPGNSNKLKRLSNGRITTSRLQNGFIRTTTGRNIKSAKKDRINRTAGPKKCRPNTKYLFPVQRETDGALTEKDFFQLIGPNDPLIFKDSVGESGEVQSMNQRFRSTGSLRRSNPFMQREFDRLTTGDGIRVGARDGRKLLHLRENDAFRQPNHASVARILYLKTESPPHFHRLNESRPIRRFFDGEMHLNTTQNLFLTMSECQRTISIEPETPLYSSDDVTLRLSLLSSPPSSSSPLVSSVSSSSSLKARPLVLNDSSFKCMSVDRDSALGSKSFSGALVTPSLMSDSVVSPLFKNLEFGRSKGSASKVPEFLSKRYCVEASLAAPHIVSLFKSAKSYQGQGVQFPPKVLFLGCRPRHPYNISIRGSNPSGIYHGCYGNIVPWNLCIPRAVGCFRRSNGVTDRRLISQPCLMMIPLTPPLAFCMM